MVSSESIPWLWIIFHSARLFKLRNKATHYSLLQFLVDYQLSILWQTHQQETPIFFWLFDLSIWMTFFVTPQICQLLPTVNLCVIFGVDLSHSHCPKPSFQCNISSMWPPVQTLQISLQCVWLTLALLSLIPSSPILHHLSPQYIVNFIHFYLIGILNCLKLCIHLHFHRTPFLLSSLYIHIPR